MKYGHNIATGPITEICSKLELSQFLGDMSGSVIEGHEEEFGLSRLRFAGGDIYVPQQPIAKGHR